MQKILSGLLALVVSIAPAISGSTAHAAALNRAIGASGQILSVDTSSNLNDGQILSVSGQGYDLNTGIYVTFCVIPPKGKRPELCGPFDITGKNNQAVWVSSNPPLYAITLVKPFKEITKSINSKKVSTGSFSVQVPATRMIGSYDCKVVKCAILTRADHTRSDYRKADVIIPVTFK